MVAALHWAVPLTGAVPTLGDSDAVTCADAVGTSISFSAIASWDGATLFGLNWAVVSSASPPRAGSAVSSCPRGAPRPKCARVLALRHKSAVVLLTNVNANPVVVQVSERDRHGAARSSAIAGAPDKASVNAAPPSSGSPSNSVSGVPCVSSPVPMTLPGAKAGETLGPSGDLLPARSAAWSPCCDSERAGDDAARVLMPIPHLVEFREEVGRSHRDRPFGHDTPAQAQVTNRYPRRRGRGPGVQKSPP